MEKRIYISPDFYMYKVAVCCMDTISGGGSGTGGDEADSKGGDWEDDDDLDGGSNIW